MVNTDMYIKEYNYISDPTIMNKYINTLSDREISIHAINNKNFYKTLLYHDISDKISLSYIHKIMTIDIKSKNFNDTLSFKIEGLRITKDNSVVEEIFPTLSAVNIDDLTIKLTMDFSNFYIKLNDCNT